MNNLCRIISTLMLTAAVLAAPALLRAQPAPNPAGDDASAAPIRLETITESQARSLSEDASDSETRETSGNETEAADIERELSFAEIRQRMLEERAVPITPENPDVDVSRPARPADATPSRPTRFKNGEGLVNRVVAVDRDEMGWLAATLLRADRDDNGDLPMIRLLQSPMLEAMEEAMDAQPDTLFQINGEVMLFRGAPYLMLRRAAIWEGPRPEAAGRPVTSDEPPDRPEPPATEGTPADASEPQETLSEAIAEETGVTPEAGSTDALADELFRDTPGQALPAPPPDRPATEPHEESVAPAKTEPLPAGERDLIADRTVRIVRSRDGRWYEVRFVGDNTLREPPMRALPSTLLDKAVALMNRPGMTNMKFRITGEVVRYKGRRYLLLRRLIEYRDMGQF
jgi:hypothetical protein